MYSEASLSSLDQLVRTQLHHRVHIGNYGLIKDVHECYLPEINYVAQEGFQFVS